MTSEEVQDAMTEVAPIAADGNQGGEEAHAGELFRVGDFSVVNEAVGIYWRGLRTPLSASESRILAHLMRRGRASWSELDQALGGPSRSRSTLQVLLGRLRQKLAQSGAPDVIQTIDGWGLALRDHRTSPAPALPRVPRRLARKFGLKADGRAQPIV